MFLLLDLILILQIWEIYLLVNKPSGLLTIATIKEKEKTSYLLVYEVPKPKENANFLLKYQDLSGKTSKLISVKMKIQDISTFKDKGSSSLKNLFTIPINLDEKMTFQLDSYELLDSVNYTYQQCSPNSCPIYQGTINAGNGKKVLYIKGSFGDSTTDEFLSFFKKYAKIQYTVSGVTLQKKLDFAINKNYLGKYIYLSVDDEILNADSIYFIFTIRTYQYFYKLKGE